METVGAAMNMVYLHRCKTTQADSASWQMLWKDEMFL